MYYDKYFPFYLAYANSILYDGERQQEDELALMKSYYPETAKRIQELIEAECQLMDYEGSRLYDEYPDRWMLLQMCKNIQRKMESEISAQDLSGRFLEELIQVLLYQEIGRRRCRRRRCRGYL